MNLFSRGSSNDLENMDDTVESKARKIPKPSLIRRISSVSSLASANGDDALSPQEGGRLRRRLLRRGDGTRINHLRHLLSQRKARQRYLANLLRRDTHSDAVSGNSLKQSGRPPEETKQQEISVLLNDKKGTEITTIHSGITSSSLDEELTDEQKEQMLKVSASMGYIKRKLDEYKHLAYNFPVEVRIENLTYSAPITEASNKIKTVYNSSMLYKVVKFCKNLGKDKVAEEASGATSKAILDRISLALEPGRLYLLLGPPGSGKTSLLKAIGGRLSTKNGENVIGKVTYNGKSLEDNTRFHIENVIAYVDQLDRHAPRLTVDETFEFAFQCKRGSHVDLTDFRFDKSDLDIAKRAAKDADAERLLVDLNFKIFGLDHVRDTFVGDSDVRGVSGGQRRRVTVGEMLLGGTPIFLGDEISNGLDASSTFEMLQILTYLTKEFKRTRVISLLQPSPETVALFDEIILMADGKVIFVGPISQVEDYFAQLGYQAPPYVDVADFLQLLSSPADCETLFNPPPEIAKIQKVPYTAGQLADLFRKSDYGKRIDGKLKAPHKHVWGSCHKDVQLADEVDHLDDLKYHRKYVNSFHKSVFLNLKRSLTLWIRDRRVLIANAAKNIIMGISVGGVFFQTDDVVSILGVLFQGMLFIMLGAMTTAPGFIDERVIYYKQADANFFSAYPFIIGKAISKLPQTTMDCVAFGTILYYMVGLANTAENFLIFMAIIISFSILMNELLFVFSTFARSKDMVQVASACLVFLFILFSGFIIPPNTIPSYYEWIYWYNPMAWAYRGLLINEYRSSEYTQEEGDFALSFTGFVDRNGEPFKKQFIGYTFIYMISHTLITLLLSSIFLDRVRVTNVPAVSDDEMESLNRQAAVASDEESTRTRISFKPVTMTFEGVCYDVKASTGNETLRLLHNVDGAFRSGRMCALMGSSGAGKTTLMDVIALRKTTGTIAGDVRLNGYPQDPTAFRRCSGYVEQFDVQTPQLTIRETVLFSARLRLDSTKVQEDVDKQAFVDQVLRTLELTPLRDVLVGDSATGGLSFEQKKRLSIAVELAASPSILFLDEPTTGLDARSALLVVKLLRKIADQGRTICATIHQPSSAVFDMFDDLLLLKKGGRVVYFGETGDESKDLIKYFEDHGAERIEIGDNPANWMLRELQARDQNVDLADEYVQSSEYATLKRQLQEVKESLIPTLKITFPNRYSVQSDVRQRLMNKRLQTIYWRSPAYNRSRLLVCSIIAGILGSVFLDNRHPSVTTEAELRASLSIIFLSFIIIGILSITSVLPVMLSIRDVFYRHRAAGMLDNVSLGWALGTAEKWFIVLASFLFCLVYVGASGISTGILGRGIRFWGIFTFNLAIYSYFGQAFMCLVPSMTTAQILASVFIGLNNFFSGLIVRPQFMTGFFEITYWITPGHYVYEGLVLAQYHGDDRTVIPVNNSEFYDFLECDQLSASQCNGTVEQFVYVFFGGRFNKDNEVQDILVLALFLVTARVMTFFALKKYNFSNI